MKTLTNFAIDKDVKGFCDHYKMSKHKILTHVNECTDKKICLPNYLNKKISKRHHEDVNYQKAYSCCGLSCNNCPFNTKENIFKFFNT